MFFSDEQLRFFGQRYTKSIHTFSGRIQKKAHKRLYIAFMHPSVFY